MTTRVVLPDGRTLRIRSGKRWHIVQGDPSQRVASADTRSRALAQWRKHSRNAPSYCVDTEQGVYDRTPDSPRIPGCSPQ